jgi:hypothetical protein
MTIITKIDEITVYEHSDGTKEVYCRLDGEGVVKLDRSFVGGEYNRWLMWKDILQMADTNDDIRHYVEQAETIYSLKK